jgi:HAD superfamily hydrolase (TIGR01509 family)
MLMKATSSCAGCFHSTPSQFVSILEAFCYSNVMITAIIFDFFDVFRTDSYKAWLLKNNLQRTGVYAEASMLSDQGKINSDEFYRQISEATGRAVTPEEVDDTAVLNTDMVNLARRLKIHYQTSLLSNAPGDFVRNLLDEYNINDIFDDILISGETGLIKPHADSFQNALKVMNVTASETLFIDDNVYNVQSADELGICSIVFTSVDQLKKDLVLIEIKF